MSLGLHNNHYLTQGDLAERLPRRAARVGLRGGRGRRYSLAERLAARTTKTETCWNISGCSVSPGGYAQIIIGYDPDGKQIRNFAHRAAWEEANGRRIPDGLTILHSCDNPRCVNPAHLSLGSQADNIHDCVLKGRRNAFGLQKLHPPDVWDIRERAAAGESNAAIAARYDIKPKTVYRIAARINWGWLPDVVEMVATVDLPVRGEVA